MFNVVLYYWLRNFCNLIGYLMHSFLGKKYEELKINGNFLF